MDNTPIEPSVKAFPVTETIEKNTTELAVSLNAHDIANALIKDKIDVFEALGVIKAANFYTTVGDKLIAEAAMNIRDGKKYKGLPYKDEAGNYRTVGDFPEFCKAFLGKSYTRTMELISNYNLLGADLYEQSEKIGFRQRDYNALKALPADDRLIIAQAIEAEDMDKALDLMQQMAAKHFREKETTAKQMDELTNVLEARDGMIKEKTDELNKKSEKINLLEAAKRKEITEVAMPGEFQLMRLQEYTRELTVKIAATLNSEIAKLYQEFNGEPPEYIELAARQALGLIISTAYGVADNMRIAPILETETAADYQAKADAEKMMAWRDGEELDVTALMSPEALANFNRLKALRPASLDN